MSGEQAWHCSSTIDISLRKMPATMLPPSSQNPMNSNLSPQTGLEETETLQAVKDGMEKIKSTVKEEAAETGLKIKDEAKAASGHLKEAGKRFAESQITSLSGKTGELAQAVTALSSKLQQGEQPNLLAGPAESCAAQLTTLSRYLNNSNPEQILHGVENLARRRPELVFGGLFLTGLLTARFLKASGTRAAEKAKEDHRQRLPRMESDPSRPGATYFNPSNV
jgi:hypothetical protein